MDDRVREHARTLVDWSARIEAGDDVVVNVAEGAHDLAVAVAAEIGDRGATLLTTYGSGEVSRAYYKAHSDDFSEPAHELALFEAADVSLQLGGGRNTAAAADVPADRRQAASKASEAVWESRYDTRWVSTVHPTRSLAQQAGMSYEAYQDFVYDAVLRDWEALADEMGQLKDILDAGSEVRIVAEGTDVTLFIEGRTAVNSAASVVYDSHNLPSGEVFTAPSGAEGEITFDVPMTVRGQRVEDVWLRFDDGAVADFSAATGEDAIGEILETDPGARRLGELGIGTNSGIDRPTDSILFDEKMAGTVHLALGRAYDTCLPEDETGNQSAVHQDLITDLRSGGRIEVDGEVVQEDGVFQWEESEA